MRVHLDLELAGVLNLTEVGADVWSRHEHTFPILCGYAFDDDPVENFTFNQQINNVVAGTDRLLNAVAGGAEIHAWNATFERTVWNNLLVPRHGFPPLPVERFHCTMATAACAGLPMNLDEAALAVGASHVKDKKGQALMKRMARPRAFRDDGTPRWWHEESMARLVQLIDYNKKDVEAERAVWRLIPRMTKRERAIWLVDQHMNMRGLPVDEHLLDALNALTLQELIRLNRGIHTRTGGVIENSSQNSRLLSWLRLKGYPHDTLSKDTLLDYIATGAYDLPAVARSVLVLRAEAAKTSTAKIKAIAKYASFDGRARHLVQYGGAVRTLRWAGRGPQIQNFPRPIIQHVNEAIGAILDGMDGEGLRVLFGRALDVVSSCLRGVFKAPPGYLFVVCDYHAIEAIVLAWLARFPALLDVFARGEDVYTFTANEIGSQNRTLGKVLRLACGYGMGGLKFRKTAAQYKLTLSMQEADDAVQAFRRANGPIVTLWQDYEQSVRNALSNPALTYWAGPVAFRMAHPNGRLRGSLLIQKPSDGYLVYRNARLSGGHIAYDGVHQYTRKWGPLDTYGGKLVENVTQAVARDLLAEAMLLFDRLFPGTLLTTVHDEIVAMVPSQHAQGTLSVLKTIMSQPPGWALDMPLSAAGYIGQRYSKA